MPLLRITNGFDTMPEARLIERATAIHQAVTGHPITFPTPDPAMGDLLDVLNEFKTAVAGLAEGGSKAQVDQKNNIRAGLVELLHLLGYYVLFTAKGNRQIALQSGFTLAKPPAPVVLAKPEQPKVEPSNQPGKMTVGVKTVRGARVYLHQYTTVEQPTEDSWTSMNCTTAKCVLEGLQTGTMYSFRVGVIGPKEQTLFSDITKRLAA